MIDANSYATVDWIVPTLHMLIGQDRGRLDRQPEIDKLEEKVKRLCAEVEQLQISLQTIANAKLRWQENVGSYAGGETWAGFSRRLQREATKVADGGGQDVPSDVGKCTLDPPRCGGIGIDSVDY